jgi:hypothetical protein
MALILTIEEFKKHVPVNASVELDWLEGDLMAVEDEFIKPVLGTEFYDLICLKHAENTLTELQAKLLYTLQHAAANLAQARFLPIQTLQFSSRGVHIITSEDEKTPFQHQIKAAEKSFQHKGFNALEQALSFLELHIDAPDFIVWAGSTAATIFKQHILSDATAFSEFYSINNSRLTFRGLLPIIKRSEAFFLEPVLGADFLAELKEELRDREPKPENVVLLDNYIRPALAYLVVAKALSEAAFTFNGSALQLNMLEETENASKAAVASERILLAKKDAAWQDGQTYLLKLKAYLNANASETKYATYFSSLLYKAPGSSDQAVHTNPTNAKVFGFI